MANYKMKTKRTTGGSVGSGASKEMDSSSEIETSSGTSYDSYLAANNNRASKIMIILDMRNRNIKSDGAYSISQIIKKENSTLEIVDLSENKLEDDGLMYLSVALRFCKYLKNLNLTNCGITEYGLRILLENLNFAYLKTFNMSGNQLGTRGVEHIVRCLSMTNLDHLCLNSIGMDDEAAKILGGAIASNNSLKILEIGWNGIKQGGSVAIARSLTNNQSLDEINLSFNQFAIEGIAALSEALKINNKLKSIDLQNNRLNYDCAKMLAAALKQNSTLKILNVGLNNITVAGVYDLLSAANTEVSKLEFLGLKSIPIQKHLVLIIELIQQRRRFACEHGSIILYPDAVSGKQNSEDESMVKLARYLSEKRMRLIDMLRILDRDPNSVEISKTEFIRRMKLFEPRLSQKDIINIAKNLSNKDNIYYSSLYDQMVRRSDVEVEIARKRTQLNEEEEKTLRAGFKQTNPNPSPKKMLKNIKNMSLLPNINLHRQRSFDERSGGESKEKSIDSYTNANLMASDGDVFTPPRRRAVNSNENINSKTKLKPLNKKAQSVNEINYADALDRKALNFNAIDTNML